ncbi:MAG: peptidase M28 family protein [Bacteroidetes bacterium B1(2017)]|nr:MAG: peptidase M28 family protein [Bacteroidetes bacterium B1(2017)]
MKNKILFLIGLMAFLPNLLIAQSDSLQVRKIVNQILLDGQCYKRLDYLSNSIGGRLSGSKEAEAAVNYTFDILKKEGFDSVWLQPVLVPHWVRGQKEEAWYWVGKKKIIPTICALGGSCGTDKKGLEAEVIEVKSIKELQALGSEKIKGKIVFYNRPMNPLFIKTFEAYGDAVDQRAAGAVEASKLGAVGVIVRSMGSNIDKHPHTGVMRVLPEVKQIPACAISTFDAEELSLALKANSRLTFSFKMSCATLADVWSYNVVAQINGSEKADEIIVVGGHLDSWDNGDGAHDDGAGVVQSMEVLHTYKALGLKPKRSIRCVLFMNEENGAKGASAYAAFAKQNQEKHIAAIESDAGGFTPRNFGATTDDAKLAKLRTWAPLLKQYGIEEVLSSGGGVDIGPLKEQGCTLIGFGPDSQRYFDVHHTAVDTFDKVSKRELELGAANIAALVWLISENGL